MSNPMHVSKAPPKILKCKCNRTHEFQDRQYGKGNRYCNPTAKAAQPNKVTTYRCTVCGDPLDG